MSLEFSFHTVVLQSPGGCPVISSSRIVLRGILRLQNEAAARGDVKRKAAEVQQQRWQPILVDIFFRKKMGIHWDDSTDWMFFWVWEQMVEKE